MRKTKSAILTLLAAALVMVVGSGAGWAQGVPRIKAKILSFDGKRITVTTGSGKDAQTMSVGVLATTRYVVEARMALGDIKSGDYAGATVSKLAKGPWQASEVHVFPAQLRGSDEGLFPLPSNPKNNIVDGTVVENANGVLGLRFRGMGPKDGPDCIGAAPRDPHQGCQGEVRITVAADVPVLVLKTANKSVLKPGAVVALSIMAGPDGRPVTPGLAVEDDGAAMPAPAKPSVSSGK